MRVPSTKFVIFYCILFLLKVQIGFGINVAFFSENLDRYSYGMLDKSMLPTTKKYKLDFSNLFHGVGQAWGSATAYEFEPGANVILEAEANSGFFFSHWTFDGEIISEDLVYKFIMPEKDVVIIGHFNEVKEPEIRIASPTANASFMEGENILVTVEAKSPNGAIERIELFRNNNLVGSVSGNPQSISFTLSNMPAASYELTARVFDVKGGRSISNPVSIVVEKANEPPLVEIISPYNGEVFAEGTPIKVEAEAEDHDGEVQKVEFFIGDNLFATVTTLPYQIIVNDLKPGEYNIAAKAFDNLGISTLSPAVQIKVEKENVPPVVRITSPEDGKVFFAGQEINIQADAKDSDGSITKVEFYSGETLIGISMASPFRVTWRDIPPGKFNLKAIAFDDKGAFSESKAVQVIVNERQELPDIQIVSPYDNQVFQEGESVYFTVMFSGDAGSVSKVTYYNGNEILGTSLEDPFDFELENARAGTYQIRAVAIGGNPQIERASSPIQIIVEPKSHTRFAITAPLHRATFQEGDDVIIQVAIPESNKKISKVEFYRGNSLLGSISQSPYSFTWDKVPAGIFNLVARLVYQDGSNLLSSIVAIKVLERPEPIITLGYVLKENQNSYLNSVQLDVNFKHLKTPVQQVALYVNDVFLGSSNSFPFTYIWHYVLPGSYRVKAIATDDFGGELVSDYIMVEIDQPDATQEEQGPLLINYSIGPNPTLDYLNLLFESLESGWDIEVDIIGMSGDQAESYRTIMIGNEVTLDLGHLRPGSYLIYLKGSQKQFPVKRFVKR